MPPEERNADLLATVLTAIAILWIIPYVPSIADATGKALTQLQTNIREKNELPQR